MSFTDQKPFFATAEDLKRSWCWGGGFHCKLCGHKFKEGDRVRWVYANGTSGSQCGNFFVCEACDGPDVLERGKNDYKKALEGAERWGIVI